MDALNEIRQICESKPSDALAQITAIVDSVRGPGMSGGDASFMAVITYMLNDGRSQEPIEFLRCWAYGDFDLIRREWPDAPAECFLAEVFPEPR